MCRTLEELKKLTMAKEADFAECQHYFLDLTETNAFLRAGEVLEEEDSFYQMLFSSIAEYFGKDARIVSSRVITIPSEDFVHGVVDLSNEKILVFYYFEDVQVGLASVIGAGEKVYHFKITLLRGQAARKAAQSCSHCAA